MLARFRGSDEGKRRVGKGDFCDRCKKRDNEYSEVYDDWKHCTHRRSLSLYFIPARDRAGFSRIGIPWHVPYPTLYIYLSREGKKY